MEAVLMSSLCVLGSLLPYKYEIKELCNVNQFKIMSDLLEHCVWSRSSLSLWYSLAQIFEEGTEMMLILVRQWSEASCACLIFVSQAQNSVRLPSCAWWLSGIRGLVLMVAVYDWANEIFSN
jgi:hypothetical protein